jgi:hypothetical protein
LIDHHAGRRSFFTNNHSFLKNTQINLNAMLTRPPRGARPAPHETGSRAANEMNHLTQRREDAEGAKKK